MNTSSNTPKTSEPLFKKKTVVGIISLIVSSVLIWIILMLWQPQQSASHDKFSWKEDSFSYSSLGHKGLVEVLQAFDWKVKRSYFQAGGNPKQTTILSLSPLLNTSPGITDLFDMSEESHQDQKENKGKGHSKNDSDLKKKQGDYDKESFSKFSQHAIFLNKPLHQGQKWVLALSKRRAINSTMHQPNWIGKTQLLTLKEVQHVLYKAIQASSVILSHLNQSEQSHKQTHKQDAKDAKYQNPFGQLNPTQVANIQSQVPSLIRTGQPGQKVKEQRCTFTAHQREKSMKIALTDTQLFTQLPSHWTPMLTCAEGVLIARYQNPSTHIELLAISDADLVSNFTIGTSNHALAFLKALQSFTSRNSTLVIDETLHGHYKYPSLMQVIFEWPLYPLVLQCLFLLIIYITYHMSRIIPPKPLPVLYRRGKQDLIQNISALLHASHYSRRACEQYFQFTTKQLIKALHINPSQSQQDLFTRLDQIAKSKDLKWNIEALQQRVHKVSRSKTRTKLVLQLALDIHQWKKDMLS